MESGKYNVNMCLERRDLGTAIKDQNDSTHGKETRDDSFGSLVYHCFMEGILYLDSNKKGQ